MKHNCIFVETSDSIKFETDLLYVIVVTCKNHFEVDRIIFEHINGHLNSFGLCQQRQRLSSPMFLDTSNRSHLETSAIFSSVLPQSLHFCSFECPGSSVENVCTST